MFSKAFILHFRAGTTSCHKFLNGVMASDSSWTLRDQSPMDWDPYNLHVLPNPIRRPFGPSSKSSRNPMEFVNIQGTGSRCIPHISHIKILIGP